MNFWDYEAWGFLNVLAVLLMALLIANILKKVFKPIKRTLIPTSVLGGILILIVTTAYKLIAKDELFNTEFFAGNGTSVLEVITYHTLALGFIASALKISEKKVVGNRGKEIFNAGITTVATYLLQGIVGLGITLIIAFFIPTFFGASGVILPFGYGQGSGQALNYGNIFENKYGFEGGKNFGLTIAALGFLSASIGGIVHLNIMKRKGRFKAKEADERIVKPENVESTNEIPMSGDMDKFTAQIILVFIAYFLTNLSMWGLSQCFKEGSNMIATVYGFNFLIGVIMATVMKVVMRFLSKKDVLKKQYTNNFLLNRISNFCFDIMVVAGIAAIDITLMRDYWGALLILGIVGLIVTFIYNKFVAKRLFKEYYDEQFLAMYGMLTGTASTGVMLLREIDPEYKTPAQDNLVYQTLPAIVFGFPIMLIAPITPEIPFIVLGILVVYFSVLNVILFRNKIFKRKQKAD